MDILTFSLTSSFSRADLPGMESEPEPERERDRGSVEIATLLRSEGLLDLLVWCCGAGVAVLCEPALLLPKTASSSNRPKL